MTHLSELVDVLAKHFLKRSSDEWLSLLEEAGVPAGPVASVGEMLAHPQTLAREMVVEVPHTRLGRQRSLGCALKMSGRPRSRAPRGAPFLGEHSREILGEAGFLEGEIAALLEKWAVMQAE